MRISEVGARAGVNASAIRYYETQGLLPAPQRTSAGYRDYPEDTVGRLRFVRRAQSAGLHLDEIKQILGIHDGGNAPCQHVVGLLQARLDRVNEQLAELEALRDQLTGLLQLPGAGDDPAAGNGDAEICWIIESAATGT